MSAFHMTENAEWVEFDTKEPTDAGSRPSGRAKRIVIPNPKGKGKGKKVVISIPRAFFPELKRYVTTGAALWDNQTLDNPSGSLAIRGLFTLITQGVTGTQRIGDAIFVERVIMRFHVYASTSAGASTVNVAAVMDKEPAAGQPAWLDVFTGTGGGSVFLYVVATPEQNNRFRFNYLKRVIVPLAATTALAGPAYTHKPVVFEFDLKVRRAVEYSPSGGARPYKGCEIDMFAWSELVANDPRITATAEIFFRDA